MTVIGAPPIAPVPAAPWSAAVAAPWNGAPLTLRRAWPRAAGHLHLEFFDPSGEMVAGQWLADADAALSAAGETATVAREDVHLVTGHGLVLQRHGADRQLTAMRPLARRRDAHVVVHRPERRAVVRITGSDGPTYVKLVRPGRSRVLAAAGARLRRHAGAAFTVPRLLDHDAGRGALTWAELPGRSLLDLGRSSAVSDVELAAAWRRAGAAIASLHALELTGAGTHSAADEMATTAGWLEHAASFGLLPPVPVAALLAPLMTGEPGPTGVLHRDLHDQQVLVPAHGPVGILDLDTLCRGELAVDVANLLVHLDLRVRQNVLTSGRAALARRWLLEGLRPDRDTLRRVPAYATATRLRLAAVYAFRPAWHRLAAGLLRSAVAGIDGHV